MGNSRRLLVVGLMLFQFLGCSSSEHLATAEQEVARFLELMAVQQFNQIYAEGAEELKKATTQQDLVKLLAAVDRKLGPAKNTEKNGWHVNFHTSGTFVTLGFKTEFQKGSDSEQFVYRISDGKALLAGYHINSNALITN